MYNVVEKGCSTPGWPGQWEGDLRRFANLTRVPRGLKRGRSRCDSSGRLSSFLVLVLGGSESESLWREGGQAKGDPSSETTHALKQARPNERPRFRLRWHWGKGKWPCFLWNSRSLARSLTHSLTHTQEDIRVGLSI